MRTMISAAYTVGRDFVAEATAEGCQARIFSFTAHESGGLPQKNPKHGTPRPKGALSRLGGEIDGSVRIRVGARGSDREARQRQMG